MPTFVGWGNASGYNGSSAALPATSPGASITTGQYFDVGPFREFTTEARVALSSTSVTNNVVTAGSVTTTFVGTITASTNHNTSGSNLEAGAVGEAFLVFTATKPYETTVFAAVTSTSTGGLTVSSTGAPSTPFYAQMNNEVILVGTVTSNTVYTISRGQNGSTATTSVVSDGISVGNIPGAAATNPNNGDMFAHAGFTNLALNTGDSIQFTWNISVTS